MREERIASRYGRALFMCVEDDAVFEQIESELCELSNLITAPESEIRTLLSNPAFSKEERFSVVKELAKTFKLQDLTQNLILLLIEKDRTQILPAIATAFSSDLDIRLGRVRADISSAHPLSQVELDEIIAALQKRVGKSIVAKVQVDEQAVMGVKAQIGGLVFDGTLSTMLDRFKRKLVDASVN